MQDSPIIVHLTLPIANFFSEPKKAKNALKTINEEVNDHVLAKCDFVILACNTAHIFAEDITGQTGIAVSSLIKRVNQKVSSKGFTSVGIVSSPLTINERLFEVDGMRLIKPSSSELTKIEKIIGKIIDGEDPKQFKSELNKIIDNLFDEGAQNVILGCTELEMALKNSKDGRLIKPLELTVSSLFAANNKTNE